MADENLDRNRREGPGDSKLPPRTWVVWLLILLLIPVLMFVNPIKRMVPTETLTTISELQKIIAEGRLKKAIIRTSASSGKAEKAL